jgi:imidazole glycerol-phosphate synthase subunit HisH
MSIAIIDYEAGNLTSVQRALHHLGFEATVTPDPDQVAKADRVIFPGVGAAGSCMANLTSSGLGQALATVVERGNPVLGICVGMQLLFEHSDEDAGTPCLGILPGIVERFQPEDRTIKVPHMGWNAVHHDGDPLFAGIADGERFYFVHSYYCAPDTEVAISAWAEHGLRFACGVRHNNLAAVQFHPEKSGAVGLTLLRNFCSGG